MALTIDFQLRPTADHDLVRQLCTDLFELSDVKVISELESYEDRNFHISGIKENFERQEFVLKVMNAKFTDRLHSENGKLRFMRDIGSRSKDLHVPVPVLSVTGSFNVLKPFKLPRSVANGLTEKQLSDNPLTDKTGEPVCQHIVRMVTYVQGEPLESVHIDRTVLYDLGTMLAELHNCSKDIKIPDLDLADGCWDIRSFHHLKHQHLENLQDKAKHNLASTILRTFEVSILPRLRNLPLTCIHGDLNEANILMVRDEALGKPRPFGIIDFGDCCNSYRIWDSAILLGYFFLETSAKNSGLNLVEVSTAILNGYFDKGGAMLREEFDILFDLALCRITQSLLIGAYQASKLDTENDYLLRTSRVGWKVLEFLLTADREVFIEAWRQLPSIRLT